MYANSTRGVFVYDDYDSIVDNPHIRTLWPLSEAMSRPLADAAETVSTRPILSLTFALNYAAGGLDPAGYHWVNLAIHIASALILFGLIRRTLTVSRAQPGLERLRAHAAEFALAVALLWLVHPLQTASVTYIVQRAESLGGLLLLATLYASMRGMQRANDMAADSTRRLGADAQTMAWYVAAVCACMLGVGAKETVAAAPILVLLYDATFVSASLTDSLRRRPLLYAGLAASWVPLYLLLSADTAALVGERRWLRYLATQPSVIVHYLRLSIWPRPLVMSYEWPYASSAGDVLPHAALVVALLATTVYGIVRRRWYGFVGAWFFLILAPSSSVVDLSQRAMEHRMYLPLATVVVLAVSAPIAVARRLRPGDPGACRSADPIPALLAAAAVLSAAVAYGAAAHARNRDYADEVEFWRGNVAALPHNYIAQLQLGRAYLRLGQLDAARTSFEAAKRTGPPFAPVHNDLGRTFLALGRYEEARNELDRALALDPTLAVAHNNLGQLAERDGRTEAAIASYRRASELRPDLTVARENLARLLASSGDASAAERELAVALGRESADAEVLTRVGLLLQAGGHHDQAEAEFRRALELNEAFVPACDALATLLARSGRYEQAQSLFERALRLDPDDVDALRNLGTLHAAGGREAEALAHWERALAIDSRLARVHYNLGLLYERRGDARAAERHYRDEIAIDPLFAPAHVQLAHVLAAVGNKAEAERHYRRALELSPDLSQARDGLAALD